MRCEPQLQKGEIFVKRVICVLLIALMVSTWFGTSSGSAETESLGEYAVDYAYYGDVNLDQQINAKDALEVLKVSV